MGGVFEVIPPHRTIKCMGWCALGHILYTWWQAMEWRQRWDTGSDVTDDTSLKGKAK